ncbi:MAG: hypothetical protein A2Y71_01835 [Bacteroidetes bacterium RBG_13_42_15]|jgi:hypothetical protein|nr:MAG: hypothetical protein A2Y71_01835 [Bacteroidetes bacterium RBG_13_42_15]
MNSKPYINHSGRKVLEYDSPDSIILDMPYIMTQGKRLNKSMPYMKLETKVAGNDIAAIRLLDFDDADGIVSLNVQELPNGRTYTISANMDYDGDMWLWTLADFDCIIGLANKEAVLSECLPAFPRAKEC